MHQGNYTMTRPPARPCESLKTRAYVLGVAPPSAAWISRWAAA